jgi:hypothetical protein
MFKNIVLKGNIQIKDEMVMAHTKHKALLGKPEERRLVKTQMQVNWIHLPQNMNQLWAL